MRVDEFDYHLPEELIAQTPLSQRDESRLLLVDPITQSLEHSQLIALLITFNPVMSWFEIIPK